MTRIPATIALILVLLGAVCATAFTFPQAAYAATEQVNSESSTEAVSNLLASAVQGLSRVEFGATEATLTTNADDGSPHSVTIDYAQLTEAGDGPAADFRSLAILGVAGSVGLRFLGLLTRLGR